MSEGFVDAFVDSDLLGSNLWPELREVFLPESR